MKQNKPKKITILDIQIVNYFNLNLTNNGIHGNQIWGILRYKFQNNIQQLMRNRLQQDMWKDYE